ncbi:hypothetical protein GLYMA_14G157900v4 [Glycine max]|uniref:Protein kinase domain-containing protein n=2 Tax=Glycine subgen. Soja TaxID=1462606 RepID=I1MAA1_SOYBN|nr:hypothetical protein GLYMA_14G157900v4 [Glycine max]RZB69119.1 Wall-associated receptor kinase 5 [Glycine soja]
MDLLFNISHICKSRSGKGLRRGPAFTLKCQAFSISSEDNEFVTVGCDTYGHLHSFLNGTKSSIGCLMRCVSKESVQSMQRQENCTGIGCWKINIPTGMKDIMIQAFNYDNFNYSSDFNNCSSSFVVKKGTYTFNIDECKTTNHTCISQNNCLNTNGSYECFCPKGRSGNGKKEEGCHQKDVTKVVIGVAAGIVILCVGTTSLYLIYQKRKLNKLRQKYFQQNGGSILLQKLSTRENSSQIQIFTQQELKKATNNFDESLIIGKGGFGTVFKGHLADNRIVAIKKSKIVDKSQSEQFANEVIVLSQINHRNVVKLLGCCLETEVPLLVYEFVNNGTLFDFIHTERKVNDATWKTRVRIAAEAAGALSYLHSEASIPIIHRDVKSANILLDDTYTAKVSDFGASRFIPLDQTELATIVQGTIGYLDPEYMQTSQLTEKSDVYSFGAVLVEMLTGEKPYSFGRPEEKRSLANHFLCCLKEDRLFDVLQVGILNEENEKEIKKVAILAAKCLRVNGEERPSMKEVAMELEMHQWINTDPNVKETDYLVHEASSNIYEPGDSSCHQEYDSITDQIPPALGDGR